NGAMSLSSTSTIGFRTWRLTSPTPQNFYLEAVFKTVACGGSDQYGLVYRAPDYSSGLGYYFGLTCTGAYSLYKWGNSGASVVLQGVSPLVNPGVNQTNRVGVMAKGNSFTFYFNDKKVQDYTDNELSDPGHIGVFIGGYSGNFNVQMDEISYWDIH
ncbi:MAG: DUF1080 domain-containing protein, partial [Anaerolineae bacterium]|nr:DUF1080 domain-containing protein [Anaerolineae bacterium]